MLEEKVFPLASADEAYQEPFKKNLAPPSQERRNPDSIKKAKQSRKKALLQFQCRVEDTIISNYILEDAKGKRVEDTIISNYILEDAKGKIASNPKENLNLMDIILGIFWRKL
ncbi:hypothetical protein U1Q18_017434 [Sarracenia purpurea var. burkii]